MKFFIHPKLGRCKTLISFEGKKNQLHLVRADFTSTKDGIEPINENQKPRHWLLWGTNGEPLDRLGKTCLLYYNGWRHSQAKAMEIFMNATQTLDNMEFIHKTTDNA